VTATLKARPGNRTLLGATVVDGGVNFAVASTVAESVAVCLLDADGTETHIDLDDYDAGVGPAGGDGRPVGHAVRLARAQALWPPDKVDYTHGSHRPRL